jgi:hypothetical protein
MKRTIEIEAKAGAEIKISETRKITELVGVGVVSALCRKPLCSRSVPLAEPLEEKGKRIE